MKVNLLALGIGPLAIALAVTVLQPAAAGEPAAAPAAPAGAIAALTTGELIDSALRAGGLDDPGHPGRLAAHRARLKGELRRLRDRFAGGRPTYRKAQRLHVWLHRQRLEAYDAGADTLAEVLDHGRYNCVSATLIYGLAARELGFDVEVLERPGHVLIRLHLRRRTVDVETTRLDGFDLAWRRPEAGGDSRGAPGFRALPFEAALGHAWLNRGWRALEAGHPLAAARSVVRAARFLPPRGGDRSAELLLGAFQPTYDVGRFDAAYEIAASELRLYPHSTSPRDRLLMAALKRVEAFCEVGNPAAGELLLIDLAGRPLDAEAAAWIGRRAAPLLATAAVRTGDWALAHRAADRFRRAEPDPDEVERLVIWIELRRRGELAGSVPLLGADFLAGPR